MNITTHTEKKFYNLLKADTGSAYDYLFENYGAIVNGIVRKIFPDPALADSIFKTIFLDICKNIQHCEQSKISLCTWLIAQTRKCLVEITSGLSEGSRKLIVNKNIIDLSYAYTKEQIAFALEVPLTIVNALIPAAVNKIRYNRN